MDHKLGIADSQKSSAVLVVTPLVALMIDQVQSLRSKAVKASIITSRSNTGISIDIIGTDSNLSSDSLLFCTPESLVRSRWRNVVERPNISKRIIAIVVDESTIVWAWGSGAKH